MFLLTRTTVFVSAAALVASTMTFAPPASARGRGIGIAAGVIGVLAVGAAIEASRKSQARAAHRPERRQSTGTRSKSVAQDDGDEDEDDGDKEAVIKMQKSLATLGFDPGPADGSPGEKTRDAIRNYQVSLKLKPTGQLNAEEQRQLWLRAMNNDRPQVGDLTQPSRVVEPMSQQYAPAVPPVPGPTHQVGLQPVSQTPSLQPQGGVVVPGALSQTGGLSGGVELTADQIKAAVGGYTYTGRETTSSLAVQMFFDQETDKAPFSKFVLSVQRAPGNWQKSEGTWFVDAEANTLCARFSSGSDGKACWRVSRGATLELARTTGNTASPAPGSLVLDNRVNGNVIAAAAN